MTVSTQCEHYLKQFSEGEFRPPYGVPQRARELSSTFRRSLENGAAKLMGKSSRPFATSHNNWGGTLQGPSVKLGFGQLWQKSLPTALVILVVILTGSWIVISRMRRNSRVERPFTCAARSGLRDIQVTWYFDDSAENVATGKDYKVITHNPAEQTYLGIVGRRLRSSQHSLETNGSSSVVWPSENSSADIPVTQQSRRGSRVSKVHLSHTNGNNNQEDENVIELRGMGKRRNFFGPKTGGFIRLAPWRSAKYEADGLLEKDKRKGKTRQALAQMGIGAVSLVGGKSIDDLFLEELLSTSNSLAHRKRTVPQRAGDCLAGLVTNEVPTGKPQIM